MLMVKLIDTISQKLINLIAVSVVSLYVNCHLRTLLCLNVICKKKIRNGYNYVKMYPTYLQHKECIIYLQRYVIQQQNHSIIMHVRVTL